jgi:hypothetical protein
LIDFVDGRLIGFVPGRFHPYEQNAIYQHFVKTLIEDNTFKSTQVNITSCENLKFCPLILKKIVGWMKSIEFVFSFKDSTIIFIEDRPDFYLGKFLNSFSDKIYGSMIHGCEGETYCQMSCNTSIFDDVADSSIAGLVVDYFTPTYAHVLDYSPLDLCTNSTQKLLQSLYSTFVDVVKHSEMKNSLLSEQSRIEFGEKYVKTLTALNMSTPEQPLYLPDQVEMIYFCDFASNQSGAFNTSENNCNLFKPFITPKGFCYTFNSLSMTEIFQLTPNLQHWDSVLSFSNKSTLMKPTGYGPTNSFNFVLNSFEYFGADPSRNNFVISITNENNPFDIVNSNYFIEPGYVYTFRVLASQMIISSDLMETGPNYRKCLLPHEIGNLNLTKMYSKSSCEYECLIQKAVKGCNCIPWYIPEFPVKNLPYCNLKNEEYKYYDDCIEETQKTFQAHECNCSADCNETSFSIIKANKLIENPPNFCSDEKIKNEFPNSVFCSLCEKIIKAQRIRFVYEHVVNGGPNPDDLDDFCDKFVTENVALVKVEMAAKTLTRSLKDKRFNFVEQLSSLGNC